MDYLNRDSFYSGVAEGTIGYDRMLTMMDVIDDQLVFEEKVALSVENYLAARRLMYWQVYMHKTSLAAEHMLEVLLKCCKQNKTNKITASNLDYFLNLQDDTPLKDDQQHLLSQYKNIDDSDIEMFLKLCIASDDILISYLASSLLTRKFLKVIVQTRPFDKTTLQSYRNSCCELFKINSLQSEWIVSENKLIFSAYEFGIKELKIRTKSNSIKNLSEIINLENYIRDEVKYFITVPKEIEEVKSDER
jgi:HD superfamily phosphohydrolase